VIPVDASTKKSVATNAMVRELLRNALSSVPLQKKSETRVPIYNLGGGLDRSVNSTPMLASDALAAVPSNDAAASAGDAPSAPPAAPIPFALAFDGNGNTSTCIPSPNNLSMPAKRSATQVSADALNLQSDTPAHTKALVDIMRQLHLEQYTTELINQGYDDLKFMSTQSEKQLQDIAALVNMLPGHAAKFVASMAKGSNASASAVPPPKVPKAAVASMAKGSNASASAAPPPKVPKAAVAESDSSYVVCIVDRSGSMRSMGMAVKNGFNEFLQEQKAFPGDCVATVVRFDDQVEVVHHGVNLSDIPAATDRTFEPRNMTALYDAIGDTIAMVQEKISTLTSKPARVMVLVLTDGQENGSRRHSHSAVMETIAHCQDKLNWTFVFVGANQDAIATGTKLGFSRDSCLSYTADATFQRRTWSSINSNFLRQRSGGDASWTAMERSSSVSMNSMIPDWDVDSDSDNQSFSTFLDVLKEGI